jgi:hypothetical protein
MTYLVARDHYEEGDAHIGDLDPKTMSEARHALGEDARVATAWPPAARFKHTPAEAIPLGQLRHDAVANSYGLLIVNTRYRDLLAAHAPDSFEMLPVQLAIAPGVEVLHGWWVAHVLCSREAVDREQSIWKPSPERRTIRLFRKLVLTGDVRREGLAVFRLREMRDVVLFRADLVEAIRAAGLTGLRFIEPAGFDSMKS